MARFKRVLAKRQSPFKREIYVLKRLVVVRLILTNVKRGGGIARHIPRNVHVPGKDLGLAREVF
jgi:hypothetical protein